MGRDFSCGTASVRGGPPQLKSGRSAPMRRAAEYLQRCSSRRRVHALERDERAGVKGETARHFVRRRRGTPSRAASAAARSPAVRGPPDPASISTRSASKSSSMFRALCLRRAITGRRSGR
jgi:hypothetical protein